MDKIDILKEQIKQAGEYVDAYTNLYKVLTEKVSTISVAKPVEKARLNVELLDVKAKLNAKKEFKENFERDIKEREAEGKFLYDQARDSEENLLKSGKMLKENELFKQKADPSDKKRLDALINHINVFKSNRQNKKEVNKSEYLSIHGDLTSLTEKYLK